MVEDAASMSLLLTLNKATSAQIAEVGFLLILAAGVWIIASESPEAEAASRPHGRGPGLALFLAGLLLLIATHWGKLGSSRRLSRCGGVDSSAEPADAPLEVEEPMDVWFCSHTGQDPATRGRPKIGQWNRRPPGRVWRSAAREEGRRKKGGGDDNACPITAPRRC